MEYLEPSYHHQHFAQLSHHMSQGPYDLHRMRGYSIPHQSSTIMAMPSSTKTNETKPRLGKEEVDILEREFEKNPKPSTQTKRQFAEDMNVELARINNWFQNRRAKRKQEKKQEAYEAGQAQETLGGSEPSSPDYFSGAGYYSDSSLLRMQQSTSTTPFQLSGPPPPVASYNPQYTDPSSATIESLQRTMAAAAASQQDFQDDFKAGSLSPFGPPLALHGPSPNDHAQFPSAEGTLAQFENSSYGSGSDFNNVYTSSEFDPSPGPMSTPVPFTYSTSAEAQSDAPSMIAPFPSQLLPPQLHNDRGSIASVNSTSHSPEDSSETAIATIFKYELSDSQKSSQSPPAPSTTQFKSPPPPTDIASRRKKVHSKPAALGPSTLSRPLAGPRTVSHAEGLRRTVASPLSSPMRRIVSAGGNKSFSGRIQKAGIESTQRSPINLGGYPDTVAFVEHNYNSIRLPLSLTAGSSLNSSLAPPTPMSPGERQMHLAKRQNSGSSASPAESSGMNFLFDASVPACFTTIEGNHNLASPPETPQASMGVTPTSNGWPSGTDPHDRQWHYEVADEPIYTPGQDRFPTELHMSQPGYLSSLSQPGTPAFGHFNPNFMFEGGVHFVKQEQYSLSGHSQCEYSFSEARGQYPKPPTFLLSQLLFSHHFAKGSAQRESLTAALEVFQKKAPLEVPIVVGGKEIKTSTLSTQQNPSNHSSTIASYSNASPSDVSAAINAALAAKPAWESLPFADRAAVFLKAADLISGKYRYDIMAATMLGQGKNAWQAEIDSAAELVDFLRFNVQYAEELYAQQPAHNSPGVWNRVEYRPLEGFVYAVTPFNFTAIAGNLPGAPALMGNVVVWKPSDSAIASNWLLYNILLEAGLPKNVIQFVPGNPEEVTKVVLAHKNFAALHYTGSTAVFRKLYGAISNGVAEGKYHGYPRVVGETGGKNFHLIHSSADTENAVIQTVRGAFEYQGQKCSATSRAYIPKSLWSQFKERLVSETSKLSVGPPTDHKNFIGPVIHAASFQKLSSTIDSAKDDKELELLVGGKHDNSTGYFIHPTIYVTSNPSHKLLSTELFGPILTIYVYDDTSSPVEAFSSVCSLIDNTSEYGLTGSVFASDRAAIRFAEDALRNSAGNFYINCKSTGAVVGQQPFGGARASGTNDKAGSMNLLGRFVSARSIKEEFIPITKVEYPSNEI
ncbi:hypothetical protein B7494_g4556 [Chlorociboria aeruginascens]|nr:hypothetical protein B7494_g4556 [Chlorociboria aeruginascens]